MKENLKPCVYKLWDHVKVGPRTFCRTVRRVADTGKVKHLRCGAEGKPSLNRAPNVNLVDAIVSMCRPETG